MINTKKIIFVIAVFFTSNFIRAQNEFSIQLNSGISDFAGISSSIQLNYSLNPDFDLYFYSGYSNTGKNGRSRYHNMNYIEGSNHSGIIESNNNVIPVYIGSTLDFFKNDWVTTFANLELGYSHLSFSTYDRMIPIESNDGDRIRYRPDKSTQEKHKENLLGTGIGVGAAHAFTQNFEVLLTFKLNTNTNFGNMNLFSKRTTFTSLQAGINYKI